MSIELDERNGYVEVNIKNKNLEKIEPLNDNYSTQDAGLNQLKSDNDIETILRNSNKRIWRILRLTLQIIILLVFIGLIAFIIAVIIVHPGCENKPELKWWQDSLIYRVDLNKIKDFVNNSDSPFIVLKDNVEYFQTNRVDAIWITNFIDLNADFVTIDEKSYGTLNEFKDLISRYHEKKIKVIIDFIPNHTKNLSPWFISSQNGDQVYQEYYVWSDNIPNDWKSEDGNLAWSKSLVNGKYYLHQFDVNEPDLNYRNPKVIEELFKSLKHWLDIGIDGFNFPTLTHIYEDYLLRSEVNSHEYTQHQRETFYLIAEIKEFFNEYKANKSREIVLMAELTDLNDNTNDTIIKRYYGTKSLGGIDLLIFNQLFKRENSVQTVNGKIFMKKIIELNKKFEEYKQTPVWMLDESNILTNSSESTVHILHAALTLLSGNTIIQINDDVYQLFVNKTIREKDNLVEDIGKFRRDHDSITYSKANYKETKDDCEYSEFMKYFDGEYSYAFFFDLENAECKSNSIKLKSNLIKGAEVGVEFVNVQYANDKKLAEALKKRTKISFNSNGLSDIEMPHNAFLILSWPYEPIDLKDYL